VSQAEFFSAWMLMPEVVVDQKGFRHEDSPWFQGRQQGGEQRPEEIEKHQNPLVSVLAEIGGRWGICFEIDPMNREVGKVTFAGYD